MNKSLDYYSNLYRSNDTSSWEHATELKKTSTIKAYVVTYITTSYEDILIGIFKDCSKAKEFIEKRSDPQNYTITEKSYLDDFVE